MKRQRLAGIEKEMSRVISQVLFEEIKNPKIRGLVSVTNIRVTEDLKFADVYFSIMSGQMNGEKAVDKETVLEGLNQIKGYLRKRVAEEIEIRYIPEIRVKLDDSIEHAIKISNIYGISFILFANSLLSKNIGIFLQLLLIILVNILSTIVITHAICRTALLDGIKYKGISRRKYNKLIEEAEKQAIEEELKRNS